jgi:hypothetical protein
MREIKAPKFVSDKVATIFLAGSIEMGAAEMWQERVVRLLANSYWTVLNRAGMIGIIAGSRVCKTNASLSRCNGCAYRKSSPRILVMQSTQDRT